MKTETKVELLKYVVLEHQYDYDVLLYKLLSRYRLNDEVARIDDRTFSFDVDTDNSKLTAKQFLVNIDFFIHYMKDYFHNIRPFYMCLEGIIDGSRAELNHLLEYRGSKFYNYYNKPDDNILDELVAKLIISNFISNAKYVGSIKDVLQDIHLPLKQVDDYTLEESMKILQLLSDVAFCQRGKSSVIQLFENIDVRLSKYSNMNLTKRKKSVEDLKKEYINSSIADYDRLFKSYNTRKQYLKYFA